nr:hypothetical protein [Tanacetum cinerariifolium]
MDSPCLEQLVIHLGSVAARIREVKCRTRGGYSKPPVKRKLVQGASSLRSTHAKAAALKDDSPFLTISDDDAGLPNVLEMQNANACHLKIFAITPSKRITWITSSMEKKRDQECEELKAKCEAAMVDFDKNPAVNVLREKIASFLGEVKEHRANLDRMLLESQKWAGYQ